MEEERKNGYVYILTIPSFREDWVKIGKTTNIEERLRTLNNTSIPLPFELYAYVESESYSEIESALHTLLTFAERRVSKNREFFNLKPADAFKLLETAAAIDKAAKIVAPDPEELDPSSTPRIRKYTVDSDEIFKFKSERGGLISARLRAIDGKYVVLQGSKIDPNITSHVDHVNFLRNENRDKIVENILIDDVAFNSPSAAGEFVSGNASNGKTDWITERDGRPLNDFIAPLTQ